MSERRTVHVFLGAPPPSSASAGGGRGEERRPDEWRHLELTWRDGRLSPVTGLEEAEDGLLEELSTQENKDTERCTSRCLIQTADRTTEAKLNAAEGDLRPADGFLREEEEPDAGQKNQCSASVLEYLESCFPAAQPEPLKPEPPRSSKQRLLPDVAPLSARTRYLTTWTLSQALILRGSGGVQSTTSPEKTPPPQTPPKEPQTPPSVPSGTPELFGPATPSPEAPAELLDQPRSMLPRVEEGGVVVEATKDGVLCSQEAEPQESRNPRGAPPKLPGVKKARLLENLGTKEPTNPPAELQGRTTLLVRCDKQGFRLSVLVAVVHPCHLKEVKVKSGAAKGTSVPLASIVVTDQSGVEMKVMLWRRAAFWALTVSPGDVLLITGLQVNEDRWRGERVLQSTFTSKLLNLGQVSASPPAPRHVDADSLRSLCVFLRERRPLLVSLNLCPPQDLSRLPYACLRSLRVNTLVHALLRVTHSHIGTAWRSEADSRFRSAVQLQAVLTVEQPLGQQGALLLWGAAVDWLPRFNRDRDQAAVWDFRFLLVRECLTSNLAELHSTSWSSARPLDPADRRAQDFFRPPQLPCGKDGGLELDIDTLLSQKYSGDAELRVQVDAFHFQDSPPSQNASQPVLDSSTPLDGILAALSGDITYTGCGRCSTELDTDANGIYGPCYRCLPNTTVRRYYRPAVLTVSGRGGRQVCVQVPPVPLQEILEAPPDKLSRNSAPGSEVKYVQVAADRIRTLLSLPRKTFVLTVRSDCLCDENSAPLSRDFTLLDLRLTDDKSKNV